MCALSLSLSLSLSLGSFAHWNACVQFLLAVLDGFPLDSWVERAGIRSAPLHTQYLASIFHAVSQMLAVGNGIAPPKRDSEYLTFIVSLVLGANMYAVFVGTLISVIEDANGSHREYCKRIDMLRTWMTQRQLPRRCLPRAREGPPPSRSDSSNRSSALALAPPPSPSLLPSPPPSPATLL